MWFAVDDGFHAHRKVKRLPRKDRAAAIGLWTLAGAWCSDQLTDGHVPAYMVDDLAGTTRTAELLVTVGLWVHDDDGYRFHDWLSYQPSAAEVHADQLRKHELKVKAGRAGGVASGIARRKHAPDPCFKQNEAEPKQTRSSGEANGKQNEAPTRPDPTRPVTGGSDRSSSHLSVASARKPRGANVGGEWVNTPRMCPIHQDHELSDLGTCNGCEADRKAASA